MSQDPCLFESHKNDKIMLIAVYVDDMMIATNDDTWLCDVKRELSYASEMKDLGKINYCLGIEFMRDEKNRVYFNQKMYTEKLLERFGMSECKPATTPMQVNHKLNKPNRVDSKEMSKYPFQNLIGALLYLFVTTRPDITFAVNYLSQFNSNYNSEHWIAAKRILRFLKNTSDYGLMYEKNDLNLFGVVDAD